MQSCCCPRKPPGSWHKVMAAQACRRSGSLLPIHSSAGEDIPSGMGMITCGPLAPEKDTAGSRASGRGADHIFHSEWKKLYLMVLTTQFPDNAPDIWSLPSHVCGKNLWGHLVRAVMVGNHSSSETIPIGFNSTQRYSRGEHMPLLGAAIVFRTITQQTYALEPQPHALSQLVSRLYHFERPGPTDAREKMQLW